MIEKLLIGAVILCLGIFTANRIEHFKSKQSFITEFNKLRVQKLGEVWKQVYVWEAMVEQTSTRLNEILAHPTVTLEEVRQTGTQMIAVLNETNAKKNDVLAAANKNRFWIDEEQYAAITAYVTATESYETELKRASDTHAADEETQSKLRGLNADRQKKRASFSVIRAQMLRE